MKNAVIYVHGKGGNLERIPYIGIYQQTFFLPIMTT